MTYINTVTVIPSIPIKPNYYWKQIKFGIHRKIKQFSTLFKLSLKMHTIPMIKDQSLLYKKLSHCQYWNCFKVLKKNRLNLILEWRIPASVYQTSICVWGSKNIKPGTAKRSFWSNICEVQITLLRRWRSSQTWLYITQYLPFN